MKKVSRIFVAVLIALGFIGQGVLRAEVRLPALFSDGAVLQRSNQVTVWGWASPDEAVEVRIAGAAAQCRATDEGAWRVELNLADASTGPHELVVRGENKIRIQDVLVGEVWICAGQSNMLMRLRSSDSAGEAETANLPQLRHFKVEGRVANTPVDDVPGRWIKAVGADVGEFSGVGYHFGKILHRELGVPVSLVNTAHGGTPVESWMSAEMIAGSPKFRRRAEIMEAAVDTPSHRLPSRLFNGKIAPVIPYRIAGIIWYQGESNAKPGQTEGYADLLRGMVGDWRARWSQGVFPFYICQLPNYGEKAAEPGEKSAWAELREQQTAFLDTPNTGQVILIDVGEENDLHPRNKRVPGERLARLALARNYGRDVVSAGPSPLSATVEGNSVRIRFRDAHGGLVAKPLSAEHQLSVTDPAAFPLVLNSPDTVLEGFQVCDENQRWHWADARIDGDSVLISAPGVVHPVAVRYAWADNPICNLYNSEGLPAGPFRTDELSATTQFKTESVEQP